MASSARIDELKKKFDENPRRYFAPLANEYRKAGDADQAIAICREFLPQQPGHMSGHIVYGQALFDAQQFEEARTVFDTALTLDPENLIALRSLGDISRNLGDAEGARAWYQRVLDADPRNDEIAAILTELAAAPAASVAPEPPPAEHTDPETGHSGTVIMGATPLDTPSEPEVLESAAQSHAAVESEPPSTDSGMLEFEPFGAAAAAAPPPESESPPPAAAPAADGLLDIEDLRFEPEAPVVPRRSTPHASLQAMGLDIERGDENAFMPGTDATADAEPPASEAADATVAAAPQFDDFTFDDGGDSTPDVEAAATPESDPFATETMAELYLSQGHPEDALRVYRQLLAQRPDDAAIEAKIESIVMMTALTPAIPMEAVPAAAAPAPAPQAAEAPPPEAMREPESVLEPAAVVEPEPVPEVESEAEPVSDFDLAVAAEQAGGGEPATEYRADAELETVVEFEMDSELEPTVEFEMDAEIEAAAEAEVVSDTESAADAEPEPAQTVPDLDASGFSLETPEEAAAGVPESMPPDAGPSIREFLSAFAVRVPPAWAEAADGGDETAAAPVGAPEAAVSAPAPIEPEAAEAPAAPAAPAPAPATVDFLAPGATVADFSAPQAGGSIDALFGGGRVATPEQAAATTLAGAFGVAGEEPASPMAGAPARRATEELSLDNVFRESPTSPPADAGGFSFDRFFTGGTPAQGTPARETPAESLPPESADADIEQFNSWLEGLKKR